MQGLRGEGFGSKVVSLECSVLFCFLLSFAKFLVPGRVMSLSNNSFYSYTSRMGVRPGPGQLQHPGSVGREHTKQSSESQSNTQRVWPQGPSLALL